MTGATIDGRAPREGPAGARLLAVALAATLAFAVSTAVASRPEPAEWEVDVFRAVNDLPDWLYVVIWPFMQYGVFVTIPIAAAFAWWKRERRLGVMLALSGVTIYLLAKVVKRIADRGRPNAYLDILAEREDFSEGSLGYTSGHAAVAATIATITVTHLPRPWREISIALVAVVGFGRMYVGAHLPLDIIGGIVMGVAAGAAATIVSDRTNSARATKGARWRTDSEPGGRHPGDVVRVVAGLSALFVSLLAVQRDRITVFETDVFRLVNDLPSHLSLVLGPVMQVGNVVAAPVIALLALLALRRRHPRVAIDITVAGLIAWVGAKVVKRLVERPRPSGLVEDINRFAGSEGLGFVSGHTAVATAIVTAAAPYLPRRARRAIWIVPWAVGAARIYYGAHLPLDIVGGAALGWVVGASLHLALGAPHRIPGLAEAEAVLRRAGQRPDAVHRVGGSPRGSFPFVARIGEEQQFVKLLDPEPRDRDWVYRLARMLIAREVRDEAALLDGPAQAHREAAMALLARANGARVPEVRGVQTRGDRVWVIQEHVSGERLDHLPPARLTDGVLDDLWSQVARLRTARVAHQDLVADNVLVDGTGRTWVVDFAHARTAVTDRALDHDVAELLVTTALLVGHDRAADAAVRVLGLEVLAAALPTLQPLALTPENRAELRNRPGLLPALRGELSDRAGIPDARVAAAHPDPLRFGLALASSLGAVTALVVVADPAEVGDVLQGVGLRWSGLALLAAALVPFAGAAAQVALSERRIALGRMAAMCAARRGISLADGEARGDEFVRAFHERTGVPGERVGGIRRAADRAHLLSTGLVAAAALAVAVARSVSLAVPDEASVLSAIAVGALALQLVRPDRRPSRDRAATSVGVPVVVAKLVEVGLDVLVAVAVVGAVGGGISTAAVVLTALVVRSVGRVAPMAGAPGLGAVIFAAASSALGMPLPEAVAAATLLTALDVWLPLVVSPPLRGLTSG